MSGEFLRKRSVQYSLIGILLLGGAVWGYAAQTRSKNTILQSGGPRAAKADAQELASLLQTARESMDRTDVTQEQRDQIWENLRAARRAVRDKRMNDYFLASRDQRQSILDKHLDEMEQYHNLVVRREQIRAAASSQPSGSSASSGRSGPGHNQRNRQERKMHSESRSPDQRARKLNYESALHGRAQQRGISMR